MWDYDLDALIRMGNMAYPWTFSLLSDALHHQRSTLRELRLGQMATQEGLVTFDIHNFPRLEVLQICTGAGRPTPYQAARLWITPKLRRLVLDCSRDDSQEGIMPLFGSTDVEWLDEFATHAALKRMHEEIGLRELELLYPSRYDWSAEDISPYHPGLNFQRAKELVEGCGFNLICPENMMPRSRMVEVDGSVDRSVDESTDESTDESVDRSVDNSVDESVE
jgi:hypothetical protein